MSFPHHDPYSQPALASSVHHEEFEQMKHSVSQRDEVIEILMQQAGNEAGDKNNYMESDFQEKDKGKGCLKVLKISFLSLQIQVAVAAGGNQPQLPIL
ncbi:hypothetical protein O181_104017 [Austropuccinia psidii MF-1]|uniref:Uncharacterized protein n=1 Tax=Austropuccinia psidii MF-1 TaxID=1389203 RepID=A0A9Q3JM91_9BASI|nr:hypothetical protein [Austropuccinia psidii MF-1]